MSELSESEKECIRYFWEEKRDLDRWVDFKRLKPIIEKEYPELIQAYEEYKISILKMNNIVFEICS